jgi:hypothetical protein
MGTLGIYEVSFHGAWIGVGGGTTRNVWCVRTLSPTSMGGAAAPASGVIAPIIGFTFNSELDAAQSLTVLAYQDSGAPLAIQNVKLTLTRIR